MILARSGFITMIRGLLRSTTHSERGRSDARRFMGCSSGFKIASMCGDVQNTLASLNTDVKPSHEHIHVFGTWMAATTRGRIGIGMKSEHITFMKAQ